MPRKGRPVRAQRWTGSAHFCAGGCGELISGGLLMDAACWRKLPPHLRISYVQAKKCGDGSGLDAAAAACTEYAGQEADV